jgi:hypothetical protein
MTDYWTSTKSPLHMWRPEYQTAELAQHLRDTVGIDPAILAADLKGVSEPQIKSFQRRLGLRKLTDPRDYRKRPS